MKKDEKNISYSFVALVLCIVLMYSICFMSLGKGISGEDYVNAAAKAEKMTVIVDAGHGGEDCGTIGVSGVYEKDLNLEIAFKLGEYLSSAGFDVVYTRTEDKLLYTEEQNIKGMRKINDLKNRMKIANSYTNAVFISIHMNFYGSSECSGLQVYYGIDGDKSKRLADGIQSEVVTRVQPANKRKIKSGNGLYLLENSLNPAVLIECGFLSNPDECEKLSEKEYQKELSFAILCGIIKYVK